MGPADTGRTVVVTDDSFTLVDDKLRLLLSHAGPASTATLPSDGSDENRLTDRKSMELALWTYLNVEEVWSGFNLIAETVAKGFQIQTRFKKDARRTDHWARAVHLDDKVRMWVKNALVFGRCVMEVGEDFCKVRDPRTLTLDQDDDGQLVKVTQEVDNQEREIPTDRVHIFTLHRLFSDDLRGISACQPVFQTIDDMLGARRVNRAIQKRYRAPIRLIEMPADATEPDRRAVQSQLEETPPDMDIVLPPGAKIHVLGHGDKGLEIDDLMKEHLTDRIFLGLGIPKIALGLPDGSNRSTSQVQRELLLQNKVAPYQRQVKQFTERLLQEALGIEATVTFDPVDTRDDKEIATVSKTLVDAGIKTPEQVEAHFWDWGEPA